MDANGWAAWVQALGSVAAIIAAIFIDQGASRRLRKDRLAEKREAVDARLLAVGNCRIALRFAANEVRLYDFADEAFHFLSAASKQRLSAGHAALDHLIASQTEVPAGILTLLTRSRAILAAARVFGEPVLREARSSVMLQLNKADEEIGELMDLYQRDQL